MWFGKKSVAPVNGGGGEAALAEAGQAQSQSQSHDDDEKDAETAKKGLSTLDIWVIMLNNVFGVAVFLRWGFAVGQAGFGLTLCMILLGTAMSVSTSFSLSALITNGAPREHAAGGVYYYLSRSMGVVLGSVIGLIFYISQAFAIAFYLLGFGELIRYTLEAYDLPREDLSVVEYASISLAACYVVGMVGTKIFAYFSSIIFATILAGVSIALLALLFAEDTTPDICKANNGSFTGPSAKNFRDNWEPEYTDGNDFLSIYGIVTQSCMAGILGGASMSGQAKDAAKSVPNGTLYGIGTMFIIYTSLALFQAISVERSCLRDDFYILQDVSWTFWVPFLGAMASTVSSGLSVIVGCSRVLQAIAFDGVFPIMHRCMYRKDTRSEPYVALTVTYGVAQALIVGNADVNTIAPLLTILILLVFTLINFACFMMSFLELPNFRPRYPYFSTSQALFGTLLGIVLIYMTDWIISFYVLLIFVGLMLYVTFILRPVNEWGDIGQAVSFSLARTLIQSMNGNEHVKYWRPQTITLSRKDPIPGLVTLGVSLGEGGGIATVLHIAQKSLELPDGTTLSPGGTEALDEVAYEAEEFRGRVRAIESTAFSSVVYGTNLEDSLVSILVGGYGNFRPNTLIVGFASYYSRHNLDESSNPNPFPDEEKNFTPIEKYTQLLLLCQAMKKVLVLARNIEKMPTSEEALHKSLASRDSNVQRMMRASGVGMSRVGPKSTSSMFIDIVALPDDVYTYEKDWSGMSPSADATATALQLAYVFQLRKVWKNSLRRRLVMFYDGLKGEEDKIAREEQAKQLMLNVRIEADLLMLPYVIPEDGHSGRSSPMLVTESISREEEEERYLKRYRASDLPDKFPLALAQAVNVALKNHEDESNSAVSFLAVSSWILAGSSIPRMHSSHGPSSSTPPRPSTPVGASTPNNDVPMQNIPTPGKQYERKDVMGMRKALNCLDGITHNLSAVAIVIPSGSKTIQLKLF